MSIFRFLYCCTFFSVINWSSASNECTPFDRHNFDNDQSNAEFINEVINTTKSVIPVFNNYTVPNYEEVIEQFQRGKNNADVYLNFTQLVTKYGYPVEQHEVVTEDGYVLTMFRIPKPCAPAVFLMHGLACSSDEWITGGTGVGLAYALADAGYDVWLGNARGNKHSRKHLKLSPDCVEFWKFGYDEIGLYDLPAMIDYILKRTGKRKLSYVGHSEGVTDFFVMASAIPAYNEKISIMICLSAVIFMGHVRSPLIQLAAPFTDVLAMLGQFIGIYELNPRNAFINAVTSTFCGSPEVAEIFCQIPLFIGCGFNFPQLNITILPVVYGHYPAGTSVRQVVQYGQAAKSGKFIRYDYGPIGNLAKYGVLEAPEYPLEKITSPIAVTFLQ